MWLKDINTRWQTTNTTLDAEKYNNFFLHFLICFTASLLIIMSKKWKIEEKKKQREGKKHFSVCLSVCVCQCVCVCAAFVCIWEIGWQHVCHRSRTPLLWSGTADGCPSNAPVSMPIQQLKQMLNADKSSKCYLPNFYNVETDSSHRSPRKNFDHKGAQINTQQYRAVSLTLLVKGLDQASVITFGLKWQL